MPVIQIKYNRFTYRLHEYIERFIYYMCILKGTQIYYIGNTVYGLHKWLRKLWS